jgi:hypothetical protein
MHVLLNAHAMLIVKQCEPQPIFVSVSKPTLEICSKSLIPSLLRPPIWMAEAPFLIVQMSILDSPTRIFALDVPVYWQMKPPPINFTAETRNKVQHTSL